MLTDKQRSFYQTLGREDKLALSRLKPQELGQELDKMMGNVPMRLVEKYKDLVPQELHKDLGLTPIYIPQPLRTVLKMHLRSGYGHHVPMRANERPTHTPPDMNSLLPTEDKDSITRRELSLAGKAPQRKGRPFIKVTGQGWLSDAQMWTQRMHGKIRAAGKAMVEAAGPGEYWYYKGQMERLLEKLDRGYIKPEDKAQRIYCETVTVCVMDENRKYTIRNLNCKKQDERKARIKEAKKAKQMREAIRAEVVKQTQAHMDAIKKMVIVGSQGQEVNHCSVLAMAGLIPGKGMGMPSFIHENGRIKSIKRD